MGLFNNELSDIDTAQLSEKVKDQLTSLTEKYFENWTNGGGVTEKEAKEFRSLAQELANRFEFMGF